MLPMKYSETSQNVRCATVRVGGADDRKSIYVGILPCFT